MGPKTTYLFLIPFTMVILWPTYKNYMGETKKTDGEIVHARQRLMKQNAEAFYLCFIMLFCTITMTLVGLMTASVTAHGICALVVFGIVTFSFSVMLHPLIAKVNAFFLFQSSAAITINGASFYFYTDTPEQYPEGPHLSPTFFITVLGVVGGIFSLLGLYIYNRYMKEMRYLGIVFTRLVVVLATVDSDSSF